MKRMLSVLLLLTLAAGPVAAQNVAASRIPPLVKYGKWAMLAGAIGLNLAALHQNHLANDIFAQLQDRCSPAGHALCTTDPSGHYVDGESEAIYQASLRADGRARTWLITGETVLLGSAAMFVWELARPKGSTKNIPFTPRVSATDGRTTVGLVVAF